MRSLDLPEDKARPAYRRILGTGNTGLLIRQDNKYAFLFLGTGSSYGSIPELPVTRSQMLEHVIQDFKLSITALANIFGVSRTAVYKWRDGGAMDDRNINLLAALYKVSQKIASYNIPLVGSKLSAPLRSGQSLLLLLDQGNDREELCRLFLDKFSKPERI